MCDLAPIPCTVDAIDALHRFTSAARTYVRGRLDADDGSTCANRMRAVGLPYALDCTYGPLVNAHALVLARECGLNTREVDLLTRLSEEGHV